MEKKKIHESKSIVNYINKMEETFPYNRMSTNKYERNS